MKQILISALTVFICASSLLAQNTKQEFIEANRLMEEKLWTESISSWNDLLVADKFNSNYNYRIGLCYLETSVDKELALKHLKVANEKDYAKMYDPFDANLKEAPKEAQYYLGRAQRLSYNFEDAIASFTAFKENISKKHFLVKEASREIQMCKEAQNQIEHPQGYIVNNMGSIVNSSASDHSPVLSIDESALFYTSRRMRADSSNSQLIDLNDPRLKEDLYVVYKDRDGNWMEPELLNINSDGHMATSSVSPDGQTLYIYIDEEGNGEIFESKLVGETWTEPIKLSSNINTSATESHASVTADGNYLYFASNRTNGSGGIDIYRAVKLPTGEWSKALSLGTIINTPYDEIAPFVHPDGKTLYFASNGHNTMGGYDIFYSKLDEETGEWSTPQNIGYPLNTVDDDVFFFPSADGKRAFYSSIQSTGLGEHDIYEIEMPGIGNADLTVLKGYIYPPDGEKLPEDLLITVTNNTTGEVTEYQPRYSDGAYVAILPPCESYKVEYFVNGNEVKQENINVPCESAYTEIQKVVHLNPLQLAENNSASEEETEMEENNSSTESNNSNNSNNTDCKDAINKLQNQIDQLKKDLKAAQNKKPEVIIKEVPVSVETKSTENINTTNNVKSTENVVTNTYDDKVGEANFMRYFVYNFNDFGVEEDKFVSFVSNIGNIINKKGKVAVKIEASASTVPTTSYSSNQELADTRADKAKERILQEMKKSGIDIDKVTFVKVEGKVNGPSYNNDAVANRTTYEKHQYVKLSAE